jgi:hypothetical protein
MGQGSRFGEKETLKTFGDARILQNAVRGVAAHEIVGDA